MQYARQEMTHAIPSDDDDRRLVQSAADGDPAAQKALVHRVSPRVSRTCRYLAGDNDAQNLAQVAVLEVLRSVKGFRGESSLDYWVDRVTVRTAAKQFEKRSRRERLFHQYAGPTETAADAEHQAAVGQIRERLAHHFSKLSEKQRGAVVLHYVYGYELPEIADLLGAKLNAVRSRLRKGLKQLRRGVLADPGLREWVQEGQR